MELTDNWRREQEFVREWIKKIKYKGDYWFRKVQGWTGSADYSEADWGEAPYRGGDNN